MTKSRLMQQPVLLLVALILFVGVVFRFLVIAPTWIHYDENYYLNIGMNFIEHGKLTPYMWRLSDDTNIIAGSGTGYGILILTWWQQLFGVSLVGVRLLMVFVGLLTAAVMYFVAKAWWGSTAAGITAAVFGVVSTSPFYSALARMDALGMLSYSIALLLHVYAVKRNARWLHFATGVMIVATAEFHILGLLYLAGLTLYYLIDYIRQVLHQRRILFNAGAIYYAIGGLIAGLLYIAVHILPDPAAYFVISEECFQCSGTSLAKELMRWQRFAILRGLEVPLLLIALVSPFFRRTQADWHFLIIAWGWLLALSIIGPPPFTHYTYHIWLLIALGLGGFVARGFAAEGTLQNWRVLLGVVAAIIMLAGNFGLHVMNFQPYELRMDPQDEDLIEAIAYVRENIPTDTVVMSDVSVFYPLKDYTEFMSYRNGYGYDKGRSETPIVEYWREERPLVVIGNWRYEDPELDIYMNEVGFTNVVPELWIADELAQ